MLNFYLNSHGFYSYWKVHRILICSNENRFCLKGVLSLPIVFSKCGIFFTTVSMLLSAYITYMSLGEFVNLLTIAVCPFDRKWEAISHLCYV